MKDKSSTKKYKIIVYIFFFAIVFVPSIIINNVDYSGHKLTMEDNKVRIKTRTFNKEDIKNIELLEDVNIRRGKTGTWTNVYSRGLAEIDGENQDARVYIYNNSNPSIKMELEDEIIIYNEKESNDTKLVYNKLLEYRK